MALQVESDGGSWQLRSEYKTPGQAVWPMARFGGGLSGSLCFGFDFDLLCLVALGAPGLLKVNCVMP